MQRCRKPCETIQKLGWLLGIGLALMLLGCNDPDVPTRSEETEERPGTTVRLVFNTLVAPSTVASLFDERPKVRLERLRFSGGGLSGSHSFHNERTATASTKMDTFRTTIRNRTRRSLGVRVRGRLGGTSFPDFAASKDLQKYARSLLRLHREQEVLLDRISSDDPLVYTVTATGDAHQIGTMIDEPYVDGYVIQKARLDWLSFALTRPLDLSFSRPTKLQEQLKARAPQNQWTFDEWEAVPVSDPVDAPEHIKRLYEEVMTLMDEKYEDGTGRGRKTPR